MGVLVPASVKSQTIQQELQRRGLTFQQAQQLARQAGVNPNNPSELAEFARANGVPEAQIQEYLSQFDALNGDGNGETEQGVVDLSGSTVSTSDIIEDIDTTDQVNEPTTSSPANNGIPYFGYDIFSDVPDPFLPSAVGPVDEGYVIGPDDEFRLTMWGATELQYELAVDAEGRTFIPSIGLVTVAGKSLRDLRESLKNTLSRSYSGLMKDPPTIFMDVTVTRFKPIELFVLGEVKNPGGYTFTSNSSLFNVLYGIGGPETSGSLRDVRIIRGGKTIASVDLYDLLINGEEGESITLLNNDRIFIPPRKNEVSVTGGVKREAIFEILNGESIGDLIKYAGGLSAEAYVDRYQIRRVIPFNERTDPSIARELIDRSLKEDLNNNTTINFNDGDEVRILSITDILPNVVEINGGVYQPGSYSISENIRTISDLILAADSLRDNAYTLKADLVRTNPNNTQSFISINLIAALKGDPSNDIVLREKDVLQIYTREDIESNYTVSITGAVRNDVEVSWKSNLRVFDLLFQAGGLFDEEYRETVLLERADLIRLNGDGLSTTIIPFDLEEALQGEGFGLSLLEPQDRIIVYAKNVQEIIGKHVNISGSVKQPGRYQFSDGMTLADLILASGGFLEDASVSLIEITRNIESDDFSLKAVTEVFNLLESSENNRFYTSDIFWELIENAKKIELSHRDEIYVRKNPQYEIQRSVTLTGEVLYPGKYTILSENEMLSSIIKRAGGLTPEAYPEGSRMLRDSNDVIIELEKIINNDRKADVYIQEGDIITIPPRPGVVLVTGNVALDGFFKYQPEQRLTYYYNQAGGMQPNTFKYLLLTQANGATYRVKRKGVFKKNPIVEDGAVIRAIFEPEPQQTDKPTIREVFTETAALLTTGLTVIFLIESIRSN